MSNIRRTLFISMLFSVLTLLSACGSKGNLYHEKPESRQGNAQANQVQKPSIESTNSQK